MAFLYSINLWPPYTKKYPSMHVLSCAYYVYLLFDIITSCDRSLNIHNLGRSIMFPVWYLLVLIPDCFTSHSLSCTCVCTLAQRLNLRLDRIILVDNFSCLVPIALNIWLSDFLLRTFHFVNFRFTLGRVGWGTHNLHLNSQTSRKFRI